MNISKYFWDLKDESLAETRKILQDPQNLKFPLRMITLLSRCDQPSQLFTVVSRETFIETWPGVRSAWKKRASQSDFRDWWETVYEQLLESRQEGQKQLKGQAPAVFQNIGRSIQDARLKKGMSQRRLSLETGVKQPDISRIEEGKKNITIFTLLRLCKVLGIKKIELE